MYDLFNQISGLLSGPINELAYGFEHIPVLFAFFLGIVGAVVPCQLTGNVSAITIYGNKSLTEKVPWLHVSLFVLGKITVFTLLGLIIWLVGKEADVFLSYLFPYFRKIIGPMLIFIGLFMMGFLRFSWPSKKKTSPSVKKSNDSYLGSYLLGVSFTVAFCPTMFVLFFMTLMPVVITTSYGIVLPSVFGIGTSLPLLIVIFLIWYFGASGAILKKSRKIGVIVQKVAGALILLIGILDTVMYWF
jgi:cytochrome c biogenesis protein CcdA